MSADFLSQDEVDALLDGIDAAKTCELKILTKLPKRLGGRLFDQAKARPIVRNAQLARRGWVHNQADGQLSLLRSLLSTHSRMMAGTPRSVYLNAFSDFLCFWSEVRDGIGHRIHRIADAVEVAGVTDLFARQTSRLA